MWKDNTTAVEPLSSLTFAHISYRCFYDCFTYLGLEQQGQILAASPFCIGKERTGEMLSPSLPCPGESPNPARRMSAFPLKPGSPEPAWAVAMLAAGPRRCYETGMLYIPRAGVRFAAGPAPAPSTEEALCFPAATKLTAVVQGLWLFNAFSTLFP